MEYLKDNDSYLHYRPMRDFPGHELEKKQKLMVR
jgi:hypothetical protein